jgi:hypothetical protein
MNRVLAPLMFGLLACVSTTPSSADAAGDAAIQISQMQVTAGPVPPISLITGVAKNVSGHRVRLVTLSFKLYDASGAVIGDAVAQAQNLDVGESWRYQATTTIPFAKTVISDISAL